MLRRCHVYQLATILTALVVGVAIWLSFGRWR
jgi:hypothetical protein